MARGKKKKLYRLDHWCNLPYSRKIKTEYIECNFECRAEEGRHSTIYLSCTYNKISKCAQGLKSKWCYGNCWNVCIFMQHHMDDLKNKGVVK